MGTTQMRAFTSFVAIGVSVSAGRGRAARASNILVVSNGFPVSGVTLPIPALGLKLPTLGPTGGARSRPVSSRAAENSSYTSQPKGKRGNRITVLGLDGGGVRGIIPATILEYLEAELQRLDGPDVRVVDYFDIVAGNSTGGLIAGILNVVDPDTKRPRYKAADATSFYLEKSKEVFPQPRCGCFGTIFTTLANIFGPKYSNKALEQNLIEKMGDLRLSEAFSDVLFPTFDVKLDQPRFLSKVEAEEDALMNPLLREACLATSAAPTFLPAVRFQTSDASGNTQEFNCVDGALASNNPTFLAVSHAIRELQKGRVFQQVPSFEGYSDFLVLSLGTGDTLNSYSATDVATWGLVSWIFKNGNVPIWDMVAAGMASTVDYNMSIFFAAQQCSDNYLRIQINNLVNASVDDSSAEYLAELMQAAKELLATQATRWTLVDGQFQLQTRPQINSEALTSFARELSEERKARGPLAS